MNKGETEIIYGDGATDDTAAIQHHIDGGKAVHPDGSEFPESKTYRISKPISLKSFGTVPNSKCESDCKKILDYTKTHWLIAAEATWKGISANLRSRIPELDKMGYKFDKEWLTLHNGKRVKQYRLSKEGGALLRRNKQ